MSGNKSSAMAAVVAAAMALSGCFSTSAPPHWLPTAEQSQRDAFGAWIRIEDSAEASRRQITEGELIAAHPDTIFILAATSLLAVPVSLVHKVTLTAYDSRYGEIVLWSFIGTVATVSHGFVLILTAPTWMISGTIASAAASRAPKVSSKDPIELRKFARFPQGLPSGLDRTSIRVKPGPVRSR